MNRHDIARRRLHNQFLWGTKYRRMEDVVGRLAALQAQEFAYARWSVAQRINGSSAAIDRAFTTGELLRTHVLRPTWHFVLPADIRWLLRLTAPRVNALNAYTYREFGLNESVFAKSNALLARALEGRKHLTRGELAAQLQAAGIEASGIRLAALLIRAELDAVVCSGPLRGKQHTYALLDDRVPAQKLMDRDEALAELTRRYYTTRGPATLRDYLWWSSLTVADGKRGIAMIERDLTSEVAEGRTYHDCSAKPGTSPPFPAIDLIQGYDEYVMSYSESKDVLFPEVGNRRTTPYLHAILLNGHLIGHWKHVVQKDVMKIETDLYRKLTAPERDALLGAAERYGRFVGTPSVLAMSGTS